MTTAVRPDRRGRSGAGGGAPAAPGQAPGPAGRRRALDRLRRGGLPYLFLLPALFMELLVHIVPMLVGIAMSFKELTRFFISDWGRAPWAGLDNYRFVVDINRPVGAALLQSFGITCAFTVLAVGLCWLFGATAAILMQDTFRGRGGLRALFLTPYALPTYASVIIWAFMFQHDNGLVNHVLHDQLALTDQPSFWLIGDNSFAALVIVSVWRTWPFAFLILMAGLQTVPRELYEASAIDGAGIWRQIRHVTMPALRPVNQVLVLVLFLWTFNDFNVPYVLFGKSAPSAGDLISVHIYQQSFVTWNFGTGSAMSVLLLLFLLVVTGLYLPLTSRSRRMRRRDA
jgi:multiple sugar transport system permease protein